MPYHIKKPGRTELNQSTLEPLSKRGKATPIAKRQRLFRHFVPAIGQSGQLV